jgi:hypothetical protein
MLLRHAPLLLALLATAGCGQVDAAVADGSPPGAADAGPDSTAASDAAPVDETALIDDLEDGDTEIRAVDGRVGYWFTVHDPSAGHQAPSPFGASPGGAADSDFAAATYGGGFTTWGAKLGLALHTAQGVVGVYDASRFHGLRFQARGNVAVRVALSTIGLRSVEYGGACTPAEGAPCADYYGSVIELTPDWQEYTIPYLQLRQAGWGQVVGFDAATAVGIEFQIDKNLDFDFAVDDVAFY